MIQLLVHGPPSLRQAVAASLVHLSGVEVLDPSLARPGPLGAIHVGASADEIPRQLRQSGAPCLVLSAPALPDPEVLVCSGDGEPGPTFVAWIALLARASGGDPPAHVLLERVDELVAVAHHDLSEPARNLSFLAWMLAEGPASAEERAEHLRRAKEASERLQLLLKELTRYARIWLRPLKPKALGPAEVEALAQEAAAEASARPQCAARPLLCAVHSGLRIDPSALRGILLELLANAFEYAGTGGAVTLEVRASEPGFAVLEILDGGPGIEAPSGDRLFRPFYRGQRDDERRTGIGLALVRAWTERAGGALRLVPTETPGRARLLLRLPAAA